MAMTSTAPERSATVPSATSSRPKASYSSALSASLAMTPHDADRMAAASRALQRCLRKVPIPTDDANASSTTSSTTKEALNDGSSQKPQSDSKNDAAKSTSDNDNPDTTAPPAFLDSIEALHKVMDRPGGTLILHEMLLEATKQCKESMIESFIPRMKASGLSEAEAKAGLVIFQEMDKSSKLKLVFGILAAASQGEINMQKEPEAESQDAEKTKQATPDHDEKENALPNKEATGEASYSTPSSKSQTKAAAALSLNSDGAVSLFTTILTAICCCVHSKDDDDIALKPVVTLDEEISTKDSFQDPPKEMTKTGEPESSATSTTSSDNKAPATPNSSLGLTKQLQSEIKSTASDAARSLIDFTMLKPEAIRKPEATTNANDNDKKPDVSISFDTFGEWYNTGGCQIASWLELLHLSKWIMPQHPTVVPSSYASTVSVSAAISSLSHKKPQLSRRLSPKPSNVRSHGHSLSTLLREDEEAMRRMTHGAASSHHHHHSRTVVTFDFTSSAECGVAKTSPLCIDLVEESLWMLRALVYRSGLIYRSAADVCKTIMRMSHKRLWDGRPLVTLRRDDFRHLIRSLITPPSPSSATKTPPNLLSSTDMENFGMILEDYFACFEGNFHQSTTSYHPLSHDEVNAKELAVGFCFLCAGNKSTKLATGFELLDDARLGYLTQQQLMRFLRSYLTMMVGTSLLRENHARKRQPLSHSRKEEMRAAVENGAHWTLSHFLKTTREKHPQSYERDAYSFEVFAEWYSKGGYAVAPWLELLDLNKLVSLLGESESFAAMPQGRHQSVLTNSQSSIRECRSSHRRQHHNRASTPPGQVLFTFPLANQRSLIVLREDAVYVRGVVEQLGALSLSAEDIWNTLTNEVKKRPELGGPNSKPRTKKNFDPDKDTLLDLKSFLEMMEVVLQSAAGSGRKRPASGTSKLSSSVQELLTNFYHSYDLKQKNEVALNELMGGLALLCGGKKSTKLAFAFGVFDGRPQSKVRKEKTKPSLKDQSLDSPDLYLFLRSFLIVLFSCCCQTLDMTDSSVDQYIADTATMVAEDVISYQWHTRKVDRVDFDDFGEWYNEGGFEIAPWLELLDLKKWVLVDSFDALDTQAPPPASAPLTTTQAEAKPSPKPSPTCPPPPPEDVLDPSFFEDNDADDIMQMDSIDEMDIMLMPSHDKDGDLLPVSKFTYSPSQDHHRVQHDQPAGDDGHSQALKFHLLSEEDENGGFKLSISQKRIRHFRQIMMASGLHDIATETACTNILKHASGSSKSKAKRTITKKGFDAAVRDILEIKDQGAGAEDNKVLLDVLSFIFSAFDVDDKGKPNALEVACGFTVLCRGKKSDKLEYAFEVLDKDKKAELTKAEMHNFMRSFLTVLLGIACTPSLDTDELEDTLTAMNGDEVCERTTASFMRAVEAGSKWAVAQVFKRRDSDAISFDDFAGWYTEEGHISIPWIELLALRKWLI